MLLSTQRPQMDEAANGRRCTSTVGNERARSQERKSRRTKDESVMEQQALRRESLAAHQLAQAVCGLWMGYGWVK